MSYHTFETWVEINDEEFFIVLGFDYYGQTENEFNPLTGIGNMGSDAEIEFNSATIDNINVLESENLDWDRLEGEAFEYIEGLS